MTASHLREARIYIDHWLTPVPMAKTKCPITRSDHPLGFVEGDILHLKQHGWGTERNPWSRFEALFLAAPYIAIATGPASQNLAVLDFDEAGSFDRWRAKNTSVLDQVRIVQTRRGFHVWYRSPEGQHRGGDLYLPGEATKVGEIKSNGFPLLPSLYPSEEPEVREGLRLQSSCEVSKDGSQPAPSYRWLTESFLENLPGILTLKDLGVSKTRHVKVVEPHPEAPFAHVCAPTHALTSTKASKSLKELKEEISNGGPSLLLHPGPLSLEVKSRILGLVRRCAPRSPGTRHLGLQKLARSVRSIQDLSDLTSDDDAFDFVMNSWVKVLQDLPHVKAKDKPTNSSEFRRLYQSCALSSSDSFDANLVDLDLGNLSNREKTRRICDRLSALNGGEDFVLSGECLARHLGVIPRGARKMLARMEKAEELQRTGTGRRSTWTANRYRLGPRFPG